jgi:hypothetical protein
VALARGVALALGGVPSGVAGALAARRLPFALLFEISPTDTTALLVVATLLLLVAPFASLCPTRRGMRVDPLIALRGDA